MRIRSKSTWMAIGVGLATTVVFTLYLFAVEPLMNKPPMKLLELQLFDWRMRTFNRLRPDPSIVHVDIDDNALKRVGRWPWPRSRIAGLIREINALGAARVVVDLLLNEHEVPYIDEPADEDFDLDPDSARLGAVSEANKQFGDLELAAALRDGGNVILALQTRSDEGAGIPAGRGGDSATPGDALATRMERLLMEEFILTESEIAARLGCAVDEVTLRVAGIKTRVARRKVASLFVEGLTPSPDAVLAAILGPAKNVNNADRRDVLNAYRRARGLARVTVSMPRVEGLDRLPLRQTENPIPPHFPFGEAALDVGAVDFTPDPDSGVRRIAALIRHGADAPGEVDRAVLHLGLAAARHALGLSGGRIALEDDGTLLLESADGRTRRNLPLDGDGNLIIPWTVTGSRWRQEGDFPHISAAKIYAIVDKRRTIEENAARRAYLLADVVAASKGELTVQPDGGAADYTIPADNAYRRRTLEHLSLRHALRLAELRGAEADEKTRELRRQEGRLAEQIARDVEPAIQNVKLNAAELDNFTIEEIEADPALKSDALRFRAAEKILREDLPRIDAVNARLAEEIAALQAELAPGLRDKTVFLGFAATALGDIVPTPIDPQTLGVMAHANVCNAVLQDHFLRQTPVWMRVLTCLLLGGAVSVVTARIMPRLTLLAVVAMLVLFVLFAGPVQFMHYRKDLLLAGPSAMLVLGWAMVTLFRQLTAERDKRIFSKQLGQYTSPAIAARIAEDPAAVAAFKAVQTRPITNYFSDLANFTTLTEREDPQTVQYVLNLYLDRMSRVIWRHGGLVNKFMGDGIMAFYNSSVLPLEDHVRVACETTLEMMEELEALKREHADKKGGELFQQLHMRAGLSTGSCMVGDLGSEFKADYTVIGDVVNLAARLEPANKVFGTQTIVSGPVRDAVRDGFEFRYLAELQVKGKQLTVPVYELICRKGALTEEQAEYIRRFESGVELYKKKEWDLCIVHFTRILARRFDDLGASRYIDACQEMKSFPPDEAEWRGALELKEK